MNSSNREIEVKYRVDGYSLTEMWTALNEMGILEVERTVEFCLTKDFYFAAPDVDIVRLRDSLGWDQNGFSRQLRELTVKRKDRGNNFNRLEINAGITDCASQLEMLTLLFGEPIAQISKEERVMWLKDGTILSLACIGSDLFLEIEGPNEDTVYWYHDLFNNEFILSREDKSLIEIYGPTVH